MDPSAPGQPPLSASLPPLSSVVPSQPLFLPNNKKRVIVIGILGIVLVTSILTILISSFFSPSRRKATISGTLDLNGYIPPGATVAISKKQGDETQFTVVTDNIPATDGVNWSWSGASPGTGYELKAILQSDGKVLGESKIKQFSAPALNEELTINSKVPSIESKTGKISGSIDLNGYIPPDSTIIVYAKRSDESQFSRIVSGITAKDNSLWSWNEAQVGSEYELKAQLLSGNVILSESDLLTLTAPADNEILRINSAAPSATPTYATPTQSIQPIPTSSSLPTLTPQPTYVPIAGFINLNGITSSSQTIAIGMRKKGELQFQTVASGLSANDKTPWIINTAQMGVLYDIQGYLQFGGNTIASSQILSTSAPASGETLTINVLSNLSQPSNSPGITCNQKNSNNLWNATISYHSMNQALQYWIRVGDINSDNRFIDTRIPPNNQSLPTTYSFTSDYLFSQGTTYFVKYAYSTCQTCTDLFYFSPFSSTGQFSCNPSPTPTITPTPTLIPPTLPPTTPTPFPTFVPMPTEIPTVIPDSSPTPLPPTNSPDDI